MKCLRPLLVPLRPGGEGRGRDENRDSALACALRGDLTANRRAGPPARTAPADGLGVKFKGDTARKGHF